MRVREALQSSSAAGTASWWKSSQDSTRASGSRSATRSRSRRSSARPKLSTRIRAAHDPRILDFSVGRRWVVVVVCVAAAVLGAWSLAQLPIDAVPDITNNQVQINTVAPALSPLEIEKQVTFPIETALAGIPGLEYTRSLSRNGFSQVTAVFTDGPTSISPASRSPSG